MTTNHKHLKLLPGLVSNFSTPELIAFAKKLEHCGLAFDKLADSLNS